MFVVIKKYPLCSMSDFVREFLQAFGQVIENKGGLRSAAVYNPDTVPASTYMPSLDMAARSLKVALITASVHSDAEIEAAIIALGRDPGGGLVGARVGAVTVDDEEAENRDLIVREVHAPDNLGIGLPLLVPPQDDTGERLVALEPAIEFGREPSAARGRCLQGCHGYVHWRLINCHYALNSAM